MNNLTLAEMRTHCEAVIRAARTGKADMNHDRAQLKALGNAPRDFRSRVHEVLAGIEEMLVEKNRAYGDSAINPIRLFSKADPREQLRVRIDDKLSRLARGKAAGEDTVKDLLGYLVLLQIAERELKTPVRQTIFIDGVECDASDIPCSCEVQR